MPSAPVAEFDDGITSTDVTTDPATTWGSDNGATAVVNSDGSVLLGAPGVANLTATYGSATSNTIQITV